MMYTAEEIAAELDPAVWEVRAETRSRAAVDPDGRDVTVHDAVLVGRRRS